MELIRADRLWLDDADLARLAARYGLDRLERVEAPPNEGQQLRMHIAPERDSGSMVFEGRQLAQRFGELELFSKLDLQILRGDKIGILGPNGEAETR